MEQVFGRTSVPLWDFLKRAMLNLKGCAAPSERQCREHHSLRVRGCLQSRDIGNLTGWVDTAGLAPNTSLLLRGCLWSRGRDLYGVKEEEREAGRGGQRATGLRLCSCLWPLRPFQEERGGIQGPGF